MVASRAVSTAEMMVVSMVASTVGLSVPSLADPKAQMKADPKVVS